MKDDRSIEEYVGIAEELAKENGGVLPNPGWLNENGYSGLAGCTSKCPALFKHLFREKDWLQIVGEMKEFVSEQGRIPNPKAFDDEKRLGLWCRSQRQKYGPRCQERIRILESIPGWTWNQGRPAMDGLKIGGTFFHMAQGANALRVGGRDDTLVVEKSDHNLILLSPDGSTMPLRHHGVTMLCDCGRKHVFYIDHNDDEFDSFVGLGGDCDCGGEFDNMTIHEVENIQVSEGGE